MNEERAQGDDDGHAHNNQTDHAKGGGVVDVEDDDDDDDKDNEDNDNNDDDDDNDDNDDDDDGGCGGRDGHHRKRKGRGQDDRTNATIK